jgi:hypothetical protein
MQQNSLFRMVKTPFLSKVIRNQRVSGEFWTTLYIKNFRWSPSCKLYQKTQP